MPHGRASVVHSRARTIPGPLFSSPGAEWSCSIALDLCVNRFQDSRGDREQSSSLAFPRCTCWVLLSPIFYHVELMRHPWLVAGLAVAPPGNPESCAVPWDYSVRSIRKQVEIGSPGFWWTWRGLCCVCLHALVHQQNASVSTS